MKIRTTRLVTALLVALALGPVATLAQTHGHAGATDTVTATDPHQANAAATPAKRPLEIADYRIWRSIEDEAISDDGRWVAWTYSRVRGDDTLTVRAVDSGAEHLVPRATDGAFSSDGRWIAYFIAQPFEEVEKLERDGERVPRRAGLLDLGTGDTLSWDDATSFGFSESGSHLWVKKRAGDPDADHDGTDLILRNLDEGYDELLGSVDELAFDSAGARLAFTVDAADGDGNGLYLVDLRAGTRRALDNSDERYAGLTWSEDGTSIAVLRGSAPEGMVERENDLIAFADVGSGSPTRFDLPAGGTGLNDGWVLSEKGRLTFDDDASTIFVGPGRSARSSTTGPRAACRSPTSTSGTGRTNASSRGSSGSSTPT